MYILSPPIFKESVKFWIILFLFFINFAHPALIVFPNLPHSLIWFSLHFFWRVLLCQQFNFIFQLGRSKKNCWVTKVQQIAGFSLSTLHNRVSRQIKYEKEIIRVHYYASDWRMEIGNPTGVNFRKFWSQASLSIFCVGISKVFPILKY